MKIFGWAADQAGCQYYRIRLPLNALDSKGHTTQFDVRMPEKCLEDKDWTIVGQRVCNPAPAKLWQALAKDGRKLIYEIDDDLLHIDPGNKVAYEFFNKPEIQKNIRDCARAASRVVVSTEPLAEVMREFNDDVVVCPNTIPSWLLNENPVRRKKEGLTIGWGGSPTHHGDFEVVRSHLRRVLDRHSGTEFHAIGTDYARWMKIPLDKCRFTPWIPDVPEFFRTIDYHIGIAPLKNHMFNRSKSHIKALECAALGIPIVASNVDPYRNFLNHGVTGFLVNGDHEWGTFLRDLINDEDMRIEMGSQAHKLASEWTIESCVEDWRKAYQL
jgi:glycosyltransferase involved in cell wall biosynthesis